MVWHIFYALSKWRTVSQSRFTFLRPLAFGPGIARIGGLTLGIGATGSLFLTLSLWSYRFFPHRHGKYLYFNICLICLFIVIVNRTMKYSNKMGQNTGISNTENSVKHIDITTDFVPDHQNLNSGTLRLKGLNSSPSCNGSDPPSKETSSCGCKNPINRFKRYIPNP